MTAPAPLHATPITAREQNTQRALRLAWLLWATLQIIPLVVFVLAISAASVAEPGASRAAIADPWFLVTMAGLLVAIPLSFFWRSHLFKDYWQGHRVSPRRYVAGMLTVWLVLAVGGTAASLGCLVSGTICPNIFPAALALALFVLFWPTGHAMDTKGEGQAEDSQDYVEPR